MNGSDAAVSTSVAIETAPSAGSSSGAPMRSQLLAGPDPVQRRRRERSLAADLLVERLGEVLRIAVRHARQRCRRIERCPDVGHTRPQHGRRLVGALLEETLFGLVVDDPAGDRQHREHQQRGAQDRDWQPPPARRGTSGCQAGGFATWHRRHCIAATVPVPCRDWHPRSRQDRPATGTLVR